MTEMELRNYLRIDKRWAWLMNLLTILAAAAAYIDSLYKSHFYRSSTRILIMHAGDKPLSNPLFTFEANDNVQVQGVTKMISDVQTEINILQDEIVQTEVMEELKNQAAIVIIDSPPFLLADASVLAARSDWVLT